MITNKLKINGSKTKFLVLTSSFSKQQFNDLQINVGNAEINPSSSARNLGVIFDSHLNWIHILVLYVDQHIFILGIFRALKI